MRRLSWEGKAWVSPRTIYPNSKHSSGLKCSPCSKEFENSRRQDKILDFFSWNIDVNQERFDRFGTRVW